MRRRRCCGWSLHHYRLAWSDPVWNHNRYPLPAGEGDHLLRAGGPSLLDAHLVRRHVTTYTILSSPMQGSHSWQSAKLRDLKSKYCFCAHVHEIMKYSCHYCDIFGSKFRSLGIPS